MIAKDKKFRFSKKKIAIASIVLLLFVGIITSIITNNKKVEEIKSIRNELKESIDHMESIQEKFDQLYVDSRSLQDRLEITIDNMLYDYYFNHWYIEE